jgi:hypothetical protein
MPTEIYFKFIQGGRLQRVEKTTNDVNIPPQILKEAANNITMSVPHAAMINDWGFLNLSLMPNGYVFATVPVQRIVLRTSLDVRNGDVNKFFVPNFASTENIVEATWKVPDDMRVILVLAMQTRGPTYCVGKSYLYAVDKRPEYWRLPLANIYEDGSVCEGREIRWFPSLMEAVVDMLSIFDKSRWTSHLWVDHEKSQRMFRFSALDKGGFDTLPVLNWPSNCTKVVVAEIQKNIVL